MTIKEVIANVDDLYPNEIPVEKKITWLRRLDEQVKEEIIDTHELPPKFKKVHFDFYDEDTELLVPDIRCDMYESYLRMRIAQVLCENKRYNMESANFNNLYITYQADYNRKYLPKTVIPNYR